MNMAPSVPKKSKEEKKDNSSFKGKIVNEARPALPVEKQSNDASSPPPKKQSSASNNDEKRTTTKRSAFKQETQTSEPHLDVVQARTDTPLRHSPAMDDEAVDEEIAIAIADGIRTEGRAPKTPPPTLSESRAQVAKTTPTERKAKSQMPSDDRDLRSPIQPAIVSTFDGVKGDHNDAIGSVTIADSDRDVDSRSIAAELSHTSTPTSIKARTSQTPNRASRTSVASAVESIQAKIIKETPKKSTSPPVSVLVRRFIYNESYDTVDSGVTCCACGRLN